METSKKLVAVCHREISSRHQSIVWLPWPPVVLAETIAGVVMHGIASSFCHGQWRPLGTVVAELGLWYWAGSVTVTASSASVEYTRSLAQTLPGPYIRRRSDGGKLGRPDAVTDLRLTQSPVVNPPKEVGQPPWRSACMLCIVGPM